MNRGAIIFRRAPIHQAASTRLRESVHPGCYQARDSSQLSIGMRPAGFAFLPSLRMLPAQKLKKMSAGRSAAIPERRVQVLEN